MFLACSTCIVRHNHVHVATRCAMLHVLWGWTSISKSAELTITWGKVDVHVCVFYAVTNQIAHYWSRTESWFHRLMIQYYVRPSDDTFKHTPTLSQTHSHTHTHTHTHSHSQLQSMRKEIKGRMKASVESGKTVSSEVIVCALIVSALAVIVVTIFST